MINRCVYLAFNLMIYNINFIMEDVLNVLKIVKYVILEQIMKNKH